LEPANYGRFLNMEPGLFLPVTEDGAKAESFWNGVAMVFQSYALYPHMTVRENMSFALEMARRPKAEIAARVEAVARAIHIDDLLDRKPAQLSGGQRQRVALGRAIVREMKVFLFDEPLSNLDAALRVAMRAEILRLHRELKSTVVYVTHDQVEAMTLGDRIVVMNRGEVQQVGAPLQLYHRPTNMFVAGFIGSPRMNFLDIEVAGIEPGGVTVKNADLAPTLIPVRGEGLAVGDKGTLGLRPEDLTLPRGGDVELRGAVELVERLGRETGLRLTTPGGAALEAIVDGAAPVAVQTFVAVAFRPEACHLFDREGRALERRSVPDIAEAPVARNRQGRAASPTIAFRNA
jgi:multiple sugar transport system ATP-binding protein